MTNPLEVLRKIEELSWNFSHKNFRTLTPQIIELLINSLRENQEFEIGICSELWQKCAIVKHDFKEINLQVELRQKSDRYDLDLVFYKSGRVSHRQRLDKEFVTLIPQGLKKLMYTVCEIGDSVRFSPGSIGEDAE